MSLCLFQSASLDANDIRIENDCCSFVSSGSAIIIWFPAVMLSEIQSFNFHPCMWTTYRIITFWTCFNQHSHMSLYNSISFKSFCFNQQVFVKMFIRIKNNWCVIDSSASVIILFKNCKKCRGCSMKFTTVNCAVTRYYTVCLILNCVLTHMFDWLDLYLWLYYSVSVDQYMIHCGVYLSLL